MKNLRQTPQQIMKNLHHLMDEVEDRLRSGQALTREQIDELRERLQAGSDRLCDCCEEFGDRVRDSYQDLEARIRDCYSEVEDRLRTSAQTTDETLRSHPYQSILVSLGIGIMIGSLLRTRSR